MGRLVDSLTDIIRPFTEQRGLRADQIRLQREDILIEIAKRARARAEVEKMTLHPVTMKLLIPFLEKASAEDTDSEMHDRWAALLLSASKEYHARHLTFLDIMSRIGSDEAKLLENVAFSFDQFPEISYPGGHLEENRFLVNGRLHELINDDLKDLPFLELYQRAGDIHEHFIDAVKIVYGRFMHTAVRTGNGSSMFYTEYGGLGKMFSSIEILEREKLIGVERLQLLEESVEACYFNLTYLGISFVRDCSPEGARRAAARLSRYPR